jgi:hypothetical protein
MVDQGDFFPHPAEAPMACRTQRNRDLSAVTRARAS